MERDRRTARSTRGRAGGENKPRHCRTATPTASKCHDVPQRPGTAPKSSCLTRRPTDCTRRVCRDFPHFVPMYATDELEPKWREGDTHTPPSHGEREGCWPPCLHGACVCVCVCARWLCPLLHCPSACHKSVYPTPMPSARIKTLRKEHMFVSRRAVVRGLATRRLPAFPLRPRARSKFEAWNADCSPVERNRGTAPSSSRLSSVIRRRKLPT